MKKKLLSIVTATALVIASTAVAFAGNVGIDINGKKVNFDSSTGAPFVDSANRTQVPLRVTMESYGCEVGWEQSTQTATVSKDGIKVEVPIGQKYININGRKLVIDTAAQVVNNRTYLPIRAVLEAFDANVTWDNTTQTVVVKDGDEVTTIPVSSDVKVHFINIGQGDSILIDAGQFEVLIDAGSKSAAQTVVNYIKPYIDGDLDVVIATHEHEDHIGGLPAVLNSYNVGKVIDNGRTSDTNIYREYAAAVTAEGCAHTTATDLTIDLGSGAKYKVMKMDGSYSDPNNNSVVSMLDYNNTQVLFMGDAEQSVEKANLSKFGDVDVLKAGHHGSDTASSTEFLAKTKPESVIISCKTGNTYKHPHLAALQRFSNIGAKVYGTQKSGDIVLTTNGTTYSLNTSAQVTTSDAGDTGSTATTPSTTTPTTPSTNVTPPTTSDTNKEYTYVGNSSTKKVHLTTCNHAVKISDKNRVYFKNLSDANGYEKCKTCNPQ